MASGFDLTSRQAHEAVVYNKAQFHGDFVKTISKQLGLPEQGNIDDSFVRSVAEWQEANLGVGQGDGKIGPQTEGSLNILLPEAEKAVKAAEEMLKRGGILFDSWGNDLRDNNNNGDLDEEDKEELGSQDGAHFGGVYKAFWVYKGSYQGGWPGMEKTITVSADKLLEGTFHYRVCADIVSQAYQAAGVMKHVRATAVILDAFRHKGIVWTRSVSYPSKYLPGDFISTYAPGHGGHSAIVVEESDTNGGANAPTVIELPGPSTQMSDGSYDPTSTNDIQRDKWPRWRIESLEKQFQFLGRLLRSKLHGR